MKFLAFIFLYSMAASAGLQDKARDILPMPLKDFKPRITTLSQVEKALGKANLVEDQNYYWEKDGLKYALKMSFDNKYILLSLHFTFTKEKPELSKLGKIDQKKFTPYPTSGSASGRYIKIKEDSTEVTFDPLTKKIHSVKLP